MMIINDLKIVSELFYKALDNLQVGVEYAESFRCLIHEV